MSEKMTHIHFKSPEDFKQRIAQLWKDQKDDEVYELTFDDEETEQEFYKLACQLNTQTDVTL